MGILCLWPFSFGKRALPILLFGLIGFAIGVLPFLTATRKISRWPFFIGVNW